jgi:hypothetical protein
MSETNYAALTPKFLTLTPGATVSLDPTQAINWKWTPAQASTLNATTAGQVGQEMTVEVVTSGTTNYLLTLGTNFAAASTLNTGNVSGARIPITFISDGISWSLKSVGGATAGGGSGAITKIVTFTENATNTVHTGTVTLPAGAFLHGIQVNNSVLWTGGTATMKVGDTADDDGYFTGVDLKATDLLVGEVLDTSPSTSWGGKEGAYLVAATGRRGPVTTNFGKYYAAGSNITGIITVGTPATTAGRTQMLVTYSIGEVIPAVVSGP